MALTIEHVLASLKNLNLRQEPDESGFCLLAEFVYVRGHACFNCTVLIGYSSTISLRTNSHYGPTPGCVFGGEIADADSLRRYSKQKSAFRFISSLSATTQYWLGSY